MGGQSSAQWASLSTVFSRIFSLFCFCITILMKLWSRSRFCENRFCHCSKKSFQIAVFKQNRYFLKPKMHWCFISFLKGGGYGKWGGKAQLNGPPRTPFFNGFFALLASASRSWWNYGHVPASVKTASVIAVKRKFWNRGFWAKSLYFKAKNALPA